jgi:hypothetical protein
MVMSKMTTSTSKASGLVCRCTYRFRFVIGHSLQRFAVRQKSRRQGNLVN